jgi:hypothetical protein
MILRTLRGIRTPITAGLSRVPLPVGLPGHEWSASAEADWDKWLPKRQPDGTTKWVLQVPDECRNDHQIVTWIIAWTPDLRMIR